MTTAAQKYSENNLFFTPIPQLPFLWLCEQYGDLSACLWVYMRTFAPGYNHYIPTLARAKNVSERTISRRVNDLVKAGAVLKILRRSANGQTITYYRALDIPKYYTAQTPELVDKPKRDPVKKSPKKTNLSLLVDNKKILKKHSEQQSSSSPRNSNLNRVNNCEGGDLTMFFDLLADAYPEQKVPRHNPRYMRSCFNQFALCTKGLNFDQIEYFVDFLIQDIKARLQFSPHWLLGNIPQFFGYLYEKRWHLPIGGAVQFDDDHHGHTTITRATERLAAWEGATGRRATMDNRIPYIPQNDLKTALLSRLHD